MTNPRVRAELSPGKEAGRDPDDEGLGNIAPEEGGRDRDDEGLGNIAPEEAGRGF